MILISALNLIVTGKPAIQESGMGADRNCRMTRTSTDSIPRKSRFFFILSEHILVTSQCQECVPIAECGQQYVPIPDS
ncbi:hypothetical protein J2T15_003254 [Paenibacillus harenae]|uniref:Secreted protein n=1 Tax=Paenibacillus harenae TaxID=306543 RepID=A0ABT9U2F6_PAEHA|nr:hypothetical protein [Paenibacillus harenae]